MASPLSPSPVSAKRSPVKPKDSTKDTDLALSLNQLSLGSPVNAPRAHKPAVDRSPSSSSPRPGSALRSPLNGPPSANGSRSRSSTPTLLRKASLNSLHSANNAPARRASSVTLSSDHTMLRSPSGTMPRSPLRNISPPEIPERPAHTAESIANNFFKDELSLRHGAHAPGPEAAPETLVVLHDSCYGHRYSRPRTSRAALSTIVERPERIKASVLGVSAAYVRLGERHAEGAHPLHPDLKSASIPGIPFRIHKTTRRLALQSQTVTNVHGTKWMEELKMMCDAAESRLAINGKELQRPDIKRDADEGIPKKFHEGDLYLCSESLDALEGALGGVCEAVDAVFSNSGPKRAFVAIRPPGHHCSASYPSGFCWINNVHVGIMHAILSHGLTHAAIIDFDLHHGDGSQTVAWQHNSRSVGLSKNAAWWKKTSIGYFSLHDINSYPCEMGDEEKVKNASLCIDNAHGQNIWNVHLQPWRSEAEFWKLYEAKYSVLLDKTRGYLQTQTERLRAAGLNSKAAIFLSAGFDASEWESAGMQRHNVNVPTDFYARFTRDVVRIAAEEGTSVEGRIISVLEGGYSDRALYSGILSHLSGLAGDDPIVRDQDFNGLGYEMGRRIGGSPGGQRVGSSGQARGRKDSSASERGTRPYEPSWWSVPELERIEATLAPAALSSPPKKPRNQTPPTYSSPTAASSAKVVEGAKVRRSMSNLSNLSNTITASRPPTPPPPEVPWHVAAHELSKLLIPADRQTGSCTHEDLAAEATRARQARQSALAGVAGTSTASTPEPRTAPSRMALRERKAKPSLPLQPEDDPKNRRKTVAGPVLGTEKAVPKMRAPSRRLSAASTVVTLDVVNGVSARPDTSQSIRPESSMSARNTPLAIKKTRPPTAVKKEPIPRQARAQKKAAADGPPKQPLRPDTSRTTSAATSAVSSGQSGDDMDKLTGDMKKIKITVVTQAQREARERDRERKERELKAKAENQPPTGHGAPGAPVVQLGDAVIEQELPVVASPAPPTVNNSSATPASTSATPEAEQDPSPRALAHPSTPITMFPVTPSKDLISAATLFSTQTPLPPSTPMIQSPAPPGPAAAAAVDDMFIPYQPEGPTPPPAVQQQQPLQWLPPNTSTPGPGPGPTPAPGRRELPVFTSTSAIPFAPRPGTGSETPVKEEEEGKSGGSVWEVPETPQC